MGGASRALPARTWRCLTWGAKLSYAAPAFALAVVGIPIYVFLPRLYTDVIGAPVALTAVRSLGSEIEITRADRSLVWTAQEAVAVTTLKRILVADAEMLFVGYEAEAVSAESVAGKVVVMLADESLNPERRILLETKQASAVIVVPEMAGQAGKQALRDVRQTSQRERLALQGEVDEVFAAVATREALARAFGKDSCASADRRDFDSYNVLGRLAGTQPDKEAVILLAHWDHLGECRPAGSPDRICNGAVDNASGLAVLLELVQRLDAQGPYERDIYVLATTAEEAGLLGAKAFVNNPPIPLSSVVAAFNFDSSAVAPAGAPVGFVGEGRSRLDTIVLQTLQDTGRDLGDRDFAERFVKRQDAWGLLQQGVPAVFVSSAFGSELYAGPYLSGAYHSPEDEAEGLELGGAVDDVLLHEQLVRRLAVPANPAP